MYVYMLEYYVCPFQIIIKLDKYMKCTEKGKDERRERERGVGGKCGVRKLAHGGGHSKNSMGIGR